MEENEAEDANFRLKLRTKPHDMLVSLHWEYLESLVKIGGIDHFRISPAVREIYDDVKANQVYKLIEYRNFWYRILDRVRWRIYAKNSKPNEIQEENSFEI